MSARVTVNVWTLILVFALGIQEQIANLSIILAMELIIALIQFAQPMEYAKI